MTARPPVGQSTRRTRPWGRQDPRPVSQTPGAGVVNSGGAIGTIRDGSPKQIAWASRIRRRKLLELANRSRSFSPVELEALDELRSQWVSAIFWIEYRRKPAIDILGMLVAVRKDRPADPFEGLA